MANRKSSNDGWKTAGLAALILLAPGGFILGFTLAAHRYGRRGRRPAGQPPSRETAEDEAADDRGS